MLNFSKLYTDILFAYTLPTSFRHKFANNFPSLENVISDKNTSSMCLYICTSTYDYKNLRSVTSDTWTKYSSKTFSGKTMSIKKYIHLIARTRAENANEYIMNIIFIDVLRQSYIPLCCKSNS